jgi:UDP-glucose 4-epimerase
MEVVFGYTYNVGTGRGKSNKEIAQTIQDVTGLELKVRYEERRPGDADTLVADVSRITNELHFEPRYSDLSTIVRSAYAWHSKSNKTDN